MAKHWNWLTRLHSHALLFYRLASLVLFASAGLLLLPSAWPQQAPPQPQQTPPQAQQTPTPQQPQDLASKSLEDLMNIQVTSVSKRKEKLSRTASAIFVITPEDIKRSGATNIPDLLRMVPGLDVAQISGDTWAISSRGFNSQIADKLLVLIDGRSVYTPLFSGVFWDEQDVPLEDIARIEVIRGPGATVWGSNAVNGVINIITKPAKDTQGGLLQGGGGTHDAILGLAQDGGTFNQDTSYRFFVTGFNNNNFPSLSGQDGQDGFGLLHGGFRVDSKLSDKNSLTFQGDLYQGAEGSVISVPLLTPPYGQQLNDTTLVAGGNLLGRWDHTFSSRSDTSLQVYFDRSSRSDSVLSQDVNTFDIDFQHHLVVGDRQNIVWGAGYRVFDYVSAGSLSVSFSPATASYQVFSSFIQDEIALVQDRVYLTLGSKFEHNDFTGFNAQPSARISWSIDKANMVWAGFSRALRTPSIAERSLVNNFAAFPGPGGLPILLSVAGDPATTNENLDAYEVGYRTQPLSNLSLDLTAYYNRYGNLSTFEPGVPFFQPNPPPPHINVPLFYSNMLYGEAHGVEASVSWQISKRWSLSPGYAFERLHLHTLPTSLDTTSGPFDEGSTPHQQAQLRSHFTIFRNLQWDTSAYFVGRIPAEQVPSYTRLDSGLTWQTSEHLSFSLFGQNLLQNTHLETNSYLQSNLSSLIKRSVYAMFSWQF